MTKNKIEYDGYSIQEKFGGNRYEYLIFNGDEIKNLLIYHALTEDEVKKTIEAALKAYEDRMKAYEERKKAMESAK